MCSASPESAPFPSDLICVQQVALGKPGPTDQRTWRKFGRLVYRLVCRGKRLVNHLERLNSPSDRLFHAHPISTTGWFPVQISQPLNWSFIHAQRACLGVSRAVLATSPGPHTAHRRTDQSFVVEQPAVVSEQGRPAGDT